LKTGKKIIIPAGILTLPVKVILMKKTTLLILCLAAVSVILIAGCTQTQVPQPTPQPTAVPTTQRADTVKAVDTALGKILVDAQGKTLYYFANDVASNGASVCNGQCATLWPPFSASTIIVSSPLDPTDFGSINRSNGTKQTTYYGWPLYYYSGDTKPGETNGENVLKVWFVIKPDESVLISHTINLGLFLTDTSGKTLYYFTKDTSGKSSCTVSCIAIWPPFSADTMTAPSVLKTGDFSQASRTDGMKQTAFMGRPLYYYSGDTKPGDVKGQGFNNFWYVANVSGSVPIVTTVPTTVPTTTRTPSLANGGGGGGGGGGY
jgi:predicted lipoprotein with Yx(FWY)xxD motif